ncbi:MAG: amino acid ABC transporter substrate-binding protein [Deltaproteobacteria bacterium]|nr:amino acid ABC transporter substrate-binding protein [Deltaproteobacteria bacterium]
MKRYSGWFAFAPALIFALGLSFSGAYGQEVIKIGMTNSLSGIFQTPATKVWQGARTWEEWINAKGGIFVKDKGKKLKVKLIYYDDETNRETLARLYERLAVTDKVDFFFAPYSSGQTIVVASIADKYKKLMIATSASAAKIYSQGYEYIVQGIERSDEFGRPYVDLIKRVDPDHMRLAMVYEDSLFPKTVATTVKKIAEELGFEIVFYDKIPRGAQDVTPVLTRVRQIKPDHIYIIALPSTSILALRQAAELKLTARSIAVLDNGMYYFKDTLGGKLLRDVLGPVEWDMSQRYKITYGPDNDEFKKWHDKIFPKKKQQLDNHSPLGFNVGLMLQRAIEETGTLDSQKLRKVFCTLRMTTLVGPQAWECENGMMHRPKDGGKPTLVTQWREDASTVTVWPPKFGDISKLVLPKRPFQ